ncbi:MAG: TrkH family potassium uptake protein [Clostridia bacterium]
MSKNPSRSLSLGFLFVILVGAFLLTLPISHNDGGWFSFIDALFTSTSAVCVTGLIVVGTAVEYSIFGQLVILFLIQIGGLGFMTIATLIFMLIGKRITLRERLLISESFNENHINGLVKLIKGVVSYTLIAEAIGAVLLAIPFAIEFGFWRGIYCGFFHSISAFCNAGFDLFGVAGAEYQGLTIFVSNAYVCLPIMLLIFMGGLGFSVHANLLNLHKKVKLLLHTKIVVIVSSVLVVLGALFYLLLEWNGAYADLSVGDKILASLFQSVTPRTAGYNTVDQAALSDVSNCITIGLMFIGASPASTGGGIKTTTFFIALILILNSFTDKGDVNYQKEHITVTMIKKTLAIFSLAVITVFCSSIMILFFERNNTEAEFNLLTVLFESVSAFSTVGLTMGITPSLSVGSKLVLILVMFVGRTGPLTLGAAIVRANKKDTKIQYPPAKIMIG